MCFWSDQTEFLFVICFYVCSMFNFHTILFAKICIFDVFLHSKYVCAYGCTLYINHMCGLETIKWKRFMTVVQYTFATVCTQTEVWIRLKCLNVTTRFEKKGLYHSLRVIKPFYANTNQTTLVMFKVSPWNWK